MYYNQRREQELYHYGVLGMKWGVRRANKRANKYAERAKGWDKLSKDAYKSGDGAAGNEYKRYAKSDRAKSIKYQKKEKNLSKQLSEKESRSSPDYKEARSIRKKRLSEMSNAELKKLNERMNLEQQYHRLNPSKIKTGLAFASATAGALGTAASLYNNSNQVVKIGKKILQK